MENLINRKAIMDFTDIILAGRKKEGEELTNKLLDTGTGIFNIYENLFKDSLYEIGLLWEMNKISVAAEHIATATVEGLMNDLYPTLPHTKLNNRKVVLGCVENELHQVGIKMVGDVFESLGWETYFLGSNNSNDALLNYIELVKPDMVAISLSVYFNMATFIGLLNKINLAFPLLPVIVGGQAFNHLDVNRPDGIELSQYHPGTKYYSNLRTLEAALTASYLS